MHANGDSIDEIREAACVENIVNDLQSNGYVPIRVVPANTFSLRIMREGKGHLKNTQVLLFTQELASLLGAGLPLDHALTTMLDLTEELPAVHRIVDGVLKQVKQGVALSDALEQQAGGFSSFYLGIIKAGEAGGDVAGSCQELADYLEKMATLRSTVVSALVYPAILLFTSIASIVLLMTLVLPQFSELFADAGKQLPMPTLVVMSISSALQQYWWLLVFLFIGIMLLIQHVSKTPLLRYKWDKRCLNMPAVGSLIKKIEVTRFSHTLSSLLAKGVPLLDALTIVKTTMSNRVMVELMDSVRQHLKQGKLISTALEGSNAFPKLAVQMIKLGEETGDLKNILDRLSITYDREVKVSIERLMALFEPILILVLGVIIAGIIFSVLMAIVSINDFAF